MEKLLTILAIIVVLTSSGCFLTPKKKSGGGGSNRTSGACGSNLLDVNSVFVDRIGTGDKARFKFNSVKPATCLIKLYSQEDGIEPSSANPREVSCGESEEKTEFVEVVVDLREDTLYFFDLTLRSGGETCSVVVRETRQQGGNGPSGTGQGAGTGGDSGSNDYAELVVARFDVPRQLVQIHRHVPANPLKLGDMRKELERQTGCQQGFPEQTAPYRSFDDDIKVRRIATKEFATGRSSRHPNFQGIYNLQYNSVNDGLDFWQWTYEYNGEDSSFLSRTGNRILNLDMKSEKTFTFEDASLEEAAEPFPINTAKDLQFTWRSSKNLLDLAYVSIFIGRSNYAKSIYCIFPAEDAKGSVPSNLLSQLADGRHVVLAQMESTQIKPLTGWIISAYDWRSGRIEK